MGIALNAYTLVMPQVGLFSLTLCADSIDIFAFSLVLAHVMPVYICALLEHISKHDAIFIWLGCVFCAPLASFLPRVKSSLLLPPRRTCPVSWRTESSPVGACWCTTMSMMPATPYRLFSDVVRRSTIASIATAVTDAPTHEPLAGAREAAELADESSAAAAPTTPPAPAPTDAPEPAPAPAQAFQVPATAVNQKMMQMTVGSLTTTTNSDVFIDRPSTVEGPFEFAAYQEKIAEKGSHRCAVPLFLLIFLASSPSWRTHISKQRQ